MPQCIPCLKFVDSDAKNCSAFFKTSSFCLFEKLQQREYHTENILIFKILDDKKFIYDIVWIQFLKVVTKMLKIYLLFKRLV